jgi:hypothetical protein
VKITIVHCELAITKPTIAITIATNLQTTQEKEKNFKFCQLQQSQREQ